MTSARIGRLSPWYLAVLLGCGYAVSFLDRSLVSAAGTPIKRALNLSDSQFGLLNGTAFVVLYSLGGIPLGRLADRVDRRRMVALGILFWSAMTALCGLAASFPLFFAARVGVGLGEASLVPAGMSLLGNVMARERMGRAVAVFIMGATSGTAVALIGGGYLLDRLGRMGALDLPLVGPLAPWQALFLLATLPGLLVAALFWRLPEPVRPVAAAAGTPGLRAAFAHVRRHGRAYGLLTAASACNIVIAQAQGAWMPQFFVRHYGLAPGAAAALVGSLFLPSAPTGQLFGGFLVDRLQARGVAGAHCVVMAACLLLAIVPGLVFATTDRLWLSEAAYPLFAFLVSAATPTGLSGIQVMTPLRLRGTMTALFLMVVTLVGIGLGPVAVGLVTDYVLADERLLGPALAGVITVTGFAGALLAFWGRRSFTRTLNVASANLFNEFA